MNRRLLLVRALWRSILAAGCTSAPAPPPFRPVADVKQLMASVVEPAAEVYWDAVGTIYDENGATEIEPQTIEEWDAVRNAAYVVAESGNLLMMSSRAKDGGDWMTMSQAMIEVGQTRDPRRRGARQDRRLRRGRRAVRHLHKLPREVRVGDLNASQS